MKAHEWYLAAGVVLVVAGTAAIYWPAALILAGLLLIRAYNKADKPNARKPE